MIKITDINIWSYIDGMKTNQTAIVGNTVFIRVEAVKINWQYLATANNSWQDIKNKYTNWNEVKNI